MYLFEWFGEGFLLEEQLLEERKRRFVVLFDFRGEFSAREGGEGGREGEGEVRMRITTGRRARERDGEGERGR